MTKVKVETLVTVTILLIGLGGGVFVFLITKAPLETLATPKTGAGRSVQVFQTCTPTEEGVRVCRAVVKICTLTDDVEERPPYAAEKRTLADRIGPAKCGPKPCSRARTRSPTLLPSEEEKRFGLGPNAYA
jgi:hypothetical protein